MEVNFCPWLCMDKEIISSLVWNTDSLLGINFPENIRISLYFSIYWFNISEFIGPLCITLLVEILQVETLTGINFRECWWLKLSSIAGKNFR